IKGDDGKDSAFEVGNFHLGRRGLCRLVSRIPGCVVVRKPSRFRWSLEDEEEFCEFELDGVRFVAWEPYGDNSRDWVGPKSPEGTPPRWCPQVDRVREAFVQARPFLGFLFGQPDGAASRSQTGRPGTDSLGADSQQQRVKEKSAWNKDPNSVS